MQKRIILYVSLIFTMIYTASLYAAYNSLGANVRNEKSTEFSIWNPDAKTITVSYETTPGSGNFTTETLKKYTQEQLSSLNTNYPGVNPYTDIYGLTVNQNLNLCEYYFSVEGVQVRDPYAKMMAGKNETYQDVETPPTSPDAPMRNCVAIDLSQIENYDFSKRPVLKNRTDAIVYETNIVNFTGSSNSGVKNPGTFTGMTQSGTCNGQSTGLQHLLDLGITHVQIMPMFSYSYAGFSYNWGYNPLNYSVPQQRYSAFPANSYVQRINEVQQMVDTFHKNGIRVIMDVVYNHMYQGNYQSASTTSKPPYYNITTKYYIMDNGNLTNYTGCGNTVDAGNSMVSNMICDSLDTWTTLYNVDGYRCDLMGIYPNSAVSKWAQYLNKKNPGQNYLFYGEPWTGNGSFPYSNGCSAGNISCTEYIKEGSLQYGAGCFNGGYRQALKGSNGKGGTGGGYLFNQSPYGGSNVDDVMQSMTYGFKGSIRNSSDHTTDSIPEAIGTWANAYTNMPVESINYVSCHDNLCLWDKICAVTGQSATDPQQYSKQIDAFCQGIVMTSQGVAFIQEGDEFLRSKYANCDSWDTAGNSYNAPAGVNELDWSLKAKNIDVFNYYQKLIKIRNNTPEFKLTSWNEINSSVKTFTSANSSTQTGVLVGQVADNSYIVIYNCNSDYDYYIASGNWKVVTSIMDILPNLSGGYPKPGDTFSSGDTVKCCGTSVTVLQNVNEGGM